MSIRFFPIIFSLIFLLALPTDGQAQIPEKPERWTDTSKSLEELSRTRPRESFASQRTDGLTVAMIFHRLTRQVPDFEDWAKATPEYQNAPDHIHYAILGEISARLEEHFRLVSVNEPIHIERYVTLKQHDRDSGGFFVDEFSDDTFFTHNFNGEYYALIPTDLMDYQWISMPADKQEDIRSHMTENNQIFMRLSLSPERGDARSRVALPNGHDNWLMSGKVLDVEFWSPRAQTLIWRSNEDFYRRKNELLNLYR